MYAQLNSSRKEIRLLHVLPGVWNDKIECHLETVSLHDNPKFYAISYVWGDPTITVPISIDGQPLNITRNLSNGLQRLRNEDTSLIIFADAACINQSDVDERSQQVTLMGEIYSSAEEVFVWLGYGRDSQAPLEKPSIVRFLGDDTDTEIVDAYFKRSASPEEEYNEFEDVLGLFVSMKIRGVDTHWGETPFFYLHEGKLIPQKTWPAVIRAVETLSKNPWWERIWVVQEIVLARQATVIYCNVTLPWNILSESVYQSTYHNFYCMNDLCYPIITHEHWEVLRDLDHAVFNGVPALQASRAKNSKASLYQVMLRTHLRDATDVRDRIYGVLGLVTDWKGVPPVVPDYSLPAKEVFVRVSFDHIQAAQSLQSLMGKTLSRIPGVPSWVTEKSHRSTRANRTAEGRFDRSYMFNAAGKTGVKAERQGDILVLDAFEPAHIVSQIGSEVFDESTTYQVWLSSVSKWHEMTQLEQETRILYPQERMREEAFWRTVTSDCWIWPEVVKDKPLENDWYATRLQRLEKTNVASLGADILNIIEERINHETEHQAREYRNDLDRVSAFMEACIMTSWDRRFFITEDGHMGLGPPEMLPGDTIAILLGGKVPFCLRAVPDAPKYNYTLVGDTYVHDLMDGEGVPLDWKDHVVRIHLH